MQLLSSCEETTTFDRIFELAVMKQQASLDNNVMATVNVVDRQKQNFKPRGNQFNQTDFNQILTKYIDTYSLNHLRWQQTINLCNLYSILTNLFLRWELAGL